MIVVVDNYDSFTHNLVQYLLVEGAEVRVVRNDEIAVEALDDADGVLLSPGPGAPRGAGVSLECVKRFAGRVPILGVCLGHQVIAEAFGARIVRAGRLMHGRTSQIHHRGEGIFGGLPSPFTATRYHSLIVDESSIPETLEVTAWTARGEIMGLRHRSLDVEGVQFHPESFLTEHGPELARRFVERVAHSSRARSENVPIGGLGVYIREVTNAVRSKA